MSRSLAELEQYLVGKWEFENNFKDSSGGGNHGTPANIEWKPTPRGIKTILEGVSSKITIGDVYDGVKTISFYAQLSSTTEQFIDLNGTANIDINAGTVQATNVTSPTIYVDGVATTSLSDVTGFHQITITTATGINVSALVVGLIGANYGAFRCDDLRMYSETFDATETLVLYNTTKDTPGVIPAERSYTHRLSPPVDNSTVFATDMYTKSGYDLIDLSGNGNNGAVAGAVRSGGYFTEGMRFDSGNLNKIVFPNIPLADTDDICAVAVFRTSSVTSAFVRIVYSQPSAFQIAIDVSGFIHVGYNLLSDDSLKTDSPISFNELHVVQFESNRDDVHKVYVDGVQQTLISSGSLGYTTAVNTIGSRDIANYYDGVIQFVSIAECEGVHFNSIAILPIFSFDAADYPANDTVYTGNIPYSSMIVTSGSFKINLDNELECVTNGIVTMSCSHQFDESEYITLDIGGVKTSGTGSVTADTITASISQGSNVITMDMDAGDKLNRLYIQFRAPVE